MPEFSDQEGGYGWYEMEDTEEQWAATEDAHNSQSLFLTRSSSSTASMSSDASRGSEDESSSSSEDNEKVVIFQFCDMQSTLSCRSFDKKASGVSINLWSSVNGYRIVQTPAGMHAEFRVVLQSNGKKIVRWKRHSDFAELAKHIEKLPKLTATKHAWQAIAFNRRWFRCLSVKYLLWKSMKFDQLLRSLLFECSDPQLLIDFAERREVIE